MKLILTFLITIIANFTAQAGPIGDILKDIETELICQDSCQFYQECKITGCTDLWWFTLIKVITCSFLASLVIWIVTKIFYCLTCKKEKTKDKDRAHWRRCSTDYIAPIV